MIDPKPQLNVNMVIVATAHTAALQRTHVEKESRGDWKSVQLEVAAAKSPAVGRRQKSLLPPASARTSNIGVSRSHDSSQKLRQSERQTHVSKEKIT